MLCCTNQAELSPLLVTLRSPLNRIVCAVICNAISRFAFALIISPFSDVVRPLNVFSHRPVFHENTGLAGGTTRPHTAHSLVDLMWIFIARLWGANASRSHDSLLGDSALIDKHCMTRREVLCYLYAATARVVFMVFVLGGVALSLMRRYRTNIV
jgi:hypothetical protein